MLFHSLLCLELSAWHFVGWQYVEWMNKRIQTHSQEFSLQPSAFPAPQPPWIREICAIAAIGDHMRMYVVEGGT
jgi:hypothetical protein